MVEVASATCQRHFLSSFSDYLDSVVQEAANRDFDRHITIDDYLQNRHRNIGTRPSYAIVELTVDLTDQILYHPTVVELSDCISELVALDNVSLEFCTCCTVK